MFAGSRFCARCGAEAKREVIEDAVPLKCPRCREQMQALRLGATRVRECGACGGLWLEPEQLQELANAREAQAEVMEVLSSRTPSATVTETVRYIPCPTCGKLMNRSNFAHSSGVVLDVCKTHGLWLDRGELQRVLYFIAAGGLADARRRDEERLIEEQRRLVALQTTPQGGAAPRSHSFTIATDHDGSNPTLASVFRDAIKLFR